MIVPEEIQQPKHFKSLFDLQYEEAMDRHENFFGPSDALDAHKNLRWLEVKAGNISEDDYMEEFGYFDRKKSIDERSNHWYNMIDNYIIEDPFTIEQLEQDPSQAQYLAVMKKNHDRGEYSLGIMSREERLSLPQQGVGMYQRSGWYESHLKELMTTHRQKKDGSFLLQSDTGQILNPEEIAKFIDEGSIDHTKILQWKTLSLDDPLWWVIGQEGTAAVLDKKAHSDYSGKDMVMELQEVEPSLWSAYIVAGGTGQRLEQAKNSYDWWYKFNSTLTDHAMALSTMKYMVEDENFFDWIIPAGISFFKESFIKDPDMTGDFTVWGSMTAAGAATGAITGLGAGTIPGAIVGGIGGGIYWLGKRVKRVQSVMDSMISMSQKAKRLNRKQRSLLYLETGVKTTEQILDVIMPTRWASFVGTKLGYVDNLTFSEKMSDALHFRKAAFTRRLKLAPFDALEGFIEGSIVHIADANERGANWTLGSMIQEGGIEAVVSIGLNPTMRAAMQGGSGLLGAGAQLTNKFVSKNNDPVITDLMNRASRIVFRPRSLEEQMEAVDKYDKFIEFGSRYKNIFGEYSHAERIEAGEAKYLFPTDPKRANRERNFLDSLFDTVQLLAQAQNVENQTSWTLNKMDEILSMLEKKVKDEKRPSMGIKEAAELSIKSLIGSIDAVVKADPDFDINLANNLKNMIASEYKTFLLLDIARNHVDPITGEKKELTIEEVIEKIDPTKDEFDVNLWFKTFTEAERELLNDEMDRRGLKLEDITDDPKLTQEIVEKVTEDWMGRTEDTRRLEDDAQKKRIEHASALSDFLEQPITIQDIRTGETIVVGGDRYTGTPLTIDEAIKKKNDTADEVESEPEIDEEEVEITELTPREQRIIRNSQERLQKGLEAYKKAKTPKEKKSALKQIANAVWKTEGRLNKITKERAGKEIIDLQNESQGILTKENIEIGPDKAGDPMDFNRVDTEVSDIKGETADTSENFVILQVKQPVIRQGNERLQYAKVVLTPAEKFTPEPIDAPQTIVPTEPPAEPKKKTKSQRRKLLEKANDAEAVAEGSFEKISEDRKEMLIDVNNIDIELAQLKAQLDQMSDEFYETEEGKKIKEIADKQAKLNEKRNELLREMGFESRTHSVDGSSLKSVKEAIISFAKEDIESEKNRLKEIEKDTNILENTKRVLAKKLGKDATDNDKQELLKQKRSILLKFLTNKRNNDTVAGIAKAAEIPVEFIKALKNNEVVSLEEFDRILSNTKIQSYLTGIIKDVKKYGTLEADVVKNNIEKANERITNAGTLASKWMENVKSGRKNLHELGKAQRAASKVHKYQEMTELRAKIANVSLAKGTSVARLADIQPDFDNLVELAYIKQVISDTKASKRDLKQRMKGKRTITKADLKIVMLGNYHTHEYIDGFFVTSEDYSGLDEDSEIDIDKARDIISSFGEWRKNTLGKHVGIQLQNATLANRRPEALNNLSDGLKTAVNIEEFGPNDKPLINITPEQAKTNAKSRRVEVKDTAESIGQLGLDLLKATKLLSNLKRLNGRYSNIGLVVAQLKQAGLENLNFDHPIFHTELSPVILKHAGDIMYDAKNELDLTELYPLDITIDGIKSDDYLNVIVDINELENILTALASQINNKLQIMVNEGIRGADTQITNMDEASLNLYKQYELVTRLHEGLLEHISTMTNPLRRGWDRDLDSQFLQLGDTTYETTPHEYRQTVENYFARGLGDIQNKRLWDGYRDLFEQYLITRKPDPKSIDLDIKELYEQILRDEVTFDHNSQITLMYKLVQEVLGIEDITQLGGLSEGSRLALDWVSAEEAGFALADFIFRREEVSLYRRVVKRKSSSKTGEGEITSEQQITDSEQGTETELQAKSVRSDIPLSARNLARNWEESVYRHRMRKSLEYLTTASDEEVELVIASIRESVPSKAEAYKKYADETGKDVKTLTAEEKTKAIKTFYLPEKEKVAKMATTYSFLPQMTNRSPGETITNFERWESFVFEVMMDWPVLGMNLIHDGRYYTDGTVVEFLGKDESHQRYADDNDLDVETLTEDQIKEAERVYPPEMLHMKPSTAARGTRAQRSEDKVRKAAHAGMPIGKLTLAGFFTQWAHGRLNINFEEFAKSALTLGNETVKSLGINNLFNFTSSKNYADLNAAGIHSHFSVLMMTPKNREAAEALLDKLVNQRNKVLGTTPEDQYLEASEFVLETALHTLEISGLHTDIFPGIQSLEKIAAEFDFEGVLKDIKAGRKKTARVEKFRKLIKHPIMVKLYWAGQEGIKSSFSDAKDAGLLEGFTEQDLDWFALFLAQGGAVLRHNLLNHALQNKDGKPTSDVLGESMGVDMGDRQEALRILKDLANQETDVVKNYMDLYGKQIEGRDTKARTLEKSLEDFVSAKALYLAQGDLARAEELKPKIRAEHKKRIENLQEYLRENGLKEESLNDPVVMNQHRGEIERIMMGWEGDAWKEMPMLRAINEKNAQPVTLAIDEKTKAAGKPAGIDMDHVGEHWLMGSLLDKFTLFIEYGIDTSSGRYNPMDPSPLTPYNSTLGSFRSDEKPYSIWKTENNRFAKMATDEEGNLDPKKMRAYINRLIAIDLSIRMIQDYDPPIPNFEPYTEKDFWADWQTESDHTVASREREINFWEDPENNDYEISKEEFNKNTYGGTRDHRSRPLFARRNIDYKSNQEMSTKDPAGIAALRPRTGKPGNLMHDRGSMFLRKESLNRKLREKEQRLEHLRNTINTTEIDTNIMSDIISGAHPFQSDTLPVGPTPDTTTLSHVFGDTIDEQVYRAIRNIENKIRPWAMERGYYKEVKDNKWGRLWIMWEMDRLHKNTIRETRQILKSFRGADVWDQNDIEIGMRQIRLSYYDKLYKLRSVVHELRSKGFDSREADIMENQLSAHINMDDMTYIELARTLADSGFAQDSRVFTPAPHHLMAIDPETAADPVEFTRTVEGPIAMHHLEQALAEHEIVFISYVNEELNILSKEDTELGKYLRDKRDTFESGRHLNWKDLQNMMWSENETVNQWAMDILDKAEKKAINAEHKNFYIYLDPDSETRSTMTYDRKEEGNVKRLWGGWSPLISQKPIGSARYHLTPEGLQQLFVNIRSTLFKKLEDRQITGISTLHSEPSLAQRLDSGYQADTRRSHEALLKAFELMGDTEVGDYTLVDKSRRSSFDDREPQRVLDIDKLSGMKIVTGNRFDHAWDRAYYSQWEATKEAARRQGKTRLLDYLINQEELNPELVKIHAISLHAENFMGLGTEEARIYAAAITNKDVDWVDKNTLLLDNLQQEINKWEFSGPLEKAIMELERHHRNTSTENTLDRTNVDNLRKVLKVFGMEDSAIDAMPEFKDYNKWMNNGLSVVIDIETDIAEDGVPTKIYRVVKHYSRKNTKAGFISEVVTGEDLNSILVEIERAQQAGYKVVTYNGNTFDFKHLVRLGADPKIAARIATRSIDLYSLLRRMKANQDSRKGSLGRISELLNLGKKKEIGGYMVHLLELRKSGKTLDKTDLPIAYRNDEIAIDELNKINDMDSSDPSLETRIVNYTLEDGVLTNKLFAELLKRQGETNISLGEIGTLDLVTELYPNWALDIDGTRAVTNKDAFKWIDDVVIPKLIGKEEDTSDFGLHNKGFVTETGSRFRDRAEREAKEFFRRGRLWADKREFNEQRDKLNGKNYDAIEVLSYQDFINEVLGESVTLTENDGRLMAAKYAMEAIMAERKPTELNLLDLTRGIDEDVDLSDLGDSKKFDLVFIHNDAALKMNKTLSRAERDGTLKPEVVVGLRIMFAHLARMNPDFFRTVEFEIDPSDIFDTQGRRQRGRFGIKDNKFHMIIDPRESTDVQIVEIALHEIIGHMGVEKFVRKNEADWVSMVEWLRTASGRNVVADFVKSNPKYSHLTEAEKNKKVEYYQTNPEEWAALYISYQLMKDVTHDSMIDINNPKINRSLRGMINKIVSSIRNHLQTITDALFRFRKTYPQAYEMMERITENAYGYQTKGNIRYRREAQTPNRVANDYESTHEGSDTENMYSFLNPLAGEQGDNALTLHAFDKNSGVKMGTPLKKGELSGLAKTEEIETWVREEENARRTRIDLRNELNNLTIGSAEHIAKQIEFDNAAKKEGEISQRISDNEYNNLFGQSRREVADNKVELARRFGDEQVVDYMLGDEANGFVMKQQQYNAGKLREIMTSSKQEDITLAKTFLALSFENMIKKRGDYVRENAERWLSMFPHIYMRLNRLATGGLAGLNTTQSDQTYLNTIIPIVILSNLVVPGLENVSGNVQNTKGWDSLDDRRNELFDIEEAAREYDKEFVKNTVDGKTMTEVQFDQIKELSLSLINDPSSVSSSHPFYDLAREYSKTSEQLIQRATDYLVNARVLQERHLEKPEHRLMLSLNKTKIGDLISKNPDVITQAKDEIRRQVLENLSLTDTSSIVDPVSLYASGILPDITSSEVNLTFIRGWDDMPLVIRNKIDQEIKNDPSLMTITEWDSDMLMLDTNPSSEAKARLKIYKIRKQKVEALYKKADYGATTLSDIIGSGTSAGEAASIISQYNSSLEAHNTSLVDKFRAHSGSYLATMILSGNGLARDSGTHMLFTSKEANSVVGFKSYLLMNRIGSTAFIPHSIVGIPKSYELMTNDKTKMLFNTDVGSISRALTRGPGWNAGTILVMKEFTNSNINFSDFLDMFRNVIDNSPDLDSINVIDQSVLNLSTKMRTDLKSKILDDIETLRRKMQITGGIALRQYNRWNSAIDTANDFTSTLLGPNLTVATLTVEGMMNTTSLMFGGPQGLKNFATAVIDSIAFASSGSTKKGRSQMRQLAREMGWYAKHKRHSMFEVHRSVLYGDELHDDEVGGLKRYLRRTKTYSNSVNGGINIALRSQSTMSYRKWFAEILGNDKLKELIIKVNDAKEKGEFKTRADIKRVVKEVLGSSHGRTEAVYQMAKAGLLDLDILPDIKTLIDESDVVYGVHTYGGRMRNYISEKTDTAERTRLNEVLRKMKNWENIVVHMNIVDPNAMDIDTTDVPLFRWLRHYKSYPNIFAAQRVFRDSSKYSLPAFVARMFRFMLQEMIYAIITMLAAGMSAAVLKERFEKNPISEMTALLQRSPMLGYWGEFIASTVRTMLSAASGKLDATPLARTLLPVGGSLMRSQSQSLVNAIRGNTDGGDWANYARMLTLAPVPVLGQIAGNPFTRIAVSRTMGKEKSANSMRQKMGDRLGKPNGRDSLRNGLGTTVEPSDSSLSSRNVFFTPEEKNLSNIMKELYPDAMNSPYVTDVGVSIDPDDIKTPEASQVIPQLPPRDTPEPKSSRVDIASKKPDPIQAISESSKPMEIPPELIE